MRRNFGPNPFRAVFTDDANNIALTNAGYALDRIEVKPFRKGREPSSISRLEGPAWDLLARTVRSVFPETIVVPYLVAGGTDARHYLELTRNVYRFSPVTLSQEDRSRLHGTNERIFIDSYLEMVRFYRQLIQNLEAPGALEGATPESS